MNYLRKLRFRLLFTKDVLDQAEKDWTKNAYSFERATTHGLCAYFSVIHKIDYNKTTYLLAELGIVENASSCLYIAPKGKPEERVNAIKKMKEILYS